MDHGVKYSFTKAEIAVFEERLRQVGYGESKSIPWTTVKKHLMKQQQVAMQPDLEEGQR